MGRGSENKPRLFVSIPFSEEFDDEYDIAFKKASHNNAFLCERADLATFTGDIMTWVRQQIETCSGVRALMNTSNANVFLEIGYAWAREVPTILVIKNGEVPPFDVKCQRDIEYKKIGELRTKLTGEIGALKERGVISA